MCLTKIDYRKGQLNGTTLQFLREFNVCNTCVVKFREFNLIIRSFKNMPTYLQLLKSTVHTYWYA